MLNLLGQIDGLKIARESQARINRQNEPHKPKPLAPLPEIKTWEEARDARHSFEMMGNATQALAETHETQFQLCEQIRDLELILTSNPTEQMKRDILGYETKQLPELPGQITPKVHVEGSLERVRAKLAQVERELPLLESKAQRYEQIRQQLAPWPWFRINRLRNEEHERQLISKGVIVQKRGQR